MSLTFLSKMIFFILATITVVAAVRALHQETHFEKEAVDAYLGKSYNAIAFTGTLVMPFYDLIIFSWAQGTQENREKTCVFFMQFILCLVPNVPYSLCVFLSEDSLTPWHNLLGTLVVGFGCFAT